MKNLFTIKVINISNIITLLFVLLSCNKRVEDNIILSSAVKNLTAKIWLFDEATIKGEGGYNLYFKKGGADPLGISAVRVKFNTDGSITGIDNTKAKIENAKWQLSPDEKQLSISGTNVFGVDGTTKIDGLNDIELKLSNKLNISQINAIVDVQGTLIHE